jgi:hypothetical protein
VWAKQWREKAKKAQRELDGLNRELRKLIDDSKRISSQRSRVISELTLELDREVKLARQPLLELEAQREHKISLIKQEAQKLLAQEKPLIETINRTLQRRENIGAEFEATSINEITIKTPALFYLPFYFVVYESGLSKRYLIIAPSNLGTPDFSAKLKGALGMSKVNNLLIPRFQALGALVTGVQTYAKQNPVFESQLLDLAERTNLLNTTIFNDNVKRGLTVFNLQGWLSERELSDSYKRLTA